MLLTLISFAFVITVLVFIHELGHYLAARSTGMRVEKFSVGFPPRFLSFTSVPQGWDLKIFFYKRENKKFVWKPIFKVFIKSENKKGSGTEYCLALLPLGGYVKVSGILDESIDSNSTGADYEYQSKKTWQKLWFTSAGVIFNFILSFLIFILLFSINGYPKNQIESVFNKIPDISIRDIKVNGVPLEGDEHFFMGINYSPEFSNSNGLITLNESIGNLSIYNLNAEEITDIEFQLPFKIEKMIEQGLQDSSQITISLIDGYRFKIKSTVNSKILNDRRIYVGKIFHEKLEYQKSPSYGILQSEDRLISINDNKVKYYKNFAPLIAQKSKNSFEIKELNIEIQREKENQIVKIKPAILEQYNEYGELLKYGKIGVTFKTEDVNFFEAIFISIDNLFEIIGRTFKGIFELITGQLSGKSVNGPIGIAKISGEFASEGFIPLLTLMAFLSISLGVINILPFPGLDGGHALIAIIEKLKGKKISAKTLIRIQQFGMLVLMSLFFLIILKDLGFL